MFEEFDIIEILILKRRFYKILLIIIVFKMLIIGKIFFLLFEII